MFLPTMSEEILTVAKRVDPNVIDLMGDQKWHRFHVYGVELERYNKEPGGMDLIPREIESGADKVKLASTPGWLLSPTEMKAILPDLEKKTASVKITVMSAEDKDKVIKNGKWFSCKHHRADGFTEINTMPSLLPLKMHHSTVLRHGQAVMLALRWTTHGKKPQVRG